MPAYMRIGNKPDWSTINYNNQKFDVLNPRKMLLDLFVYQNEPIEWDMKTIVLIGPQGSGKTVTIRYFVALIQSIKKYKGNVAVIRTNDLRILSDHRYYHLFDEKSVIVLIVDDVIREGFDSRRAMSGSNVELTRQYCITRHILEENFRPNGIIFLIFASQVLTRLDPTIRDNAQLKIFTAYYDQRWFNGLFTPEQSELIRIATYEGMFSSNFDARRFALCKTLTGDVATIEVPFSRTEDVPINYVDRAIHHDGAIDLMVERLLLEIDNFTDFKQNELMGFLIEVSDSIEKDFSIKLKGNDFTKAIRIASWKRKKQVMAIDDNILNIELSGEMSNKDKIVACVEMNKIASVEQIANFTKINLPLVNAYLANNKDMFERVCKGHYSIKGNNYTMNDVYDLTNKKPEIKMKLLEM